MQGPMDVGGITSSMASDVAAESAGATATTASMSLLRAAMDTSTQMMDQLLEGLEAPNPPGVGGSVNTYA